MPSYEIHVCDADCLINLQQHFGRKAVSALRHSGKNGGFKLPEGIVRELIHGADKVGKFVQQERRRLEVLARQIPALHKVIPRLERLYGERIRVGTQEYAGFWRSKSGRKAADAQIIAVAKNMHDATVVSDDRAVKLACALEGVPCIGWSEFARRLGLIGPEQLNLVFT